MRGAGEAVLEGEAEGLEWKGGVGEVANEAVEVGVEAAEGQGCEDGEAGVGGRGERRSGEGGSHEAGDGEEALACQGDGGEAAVDQLPALVGRSTHVSPPIPKCNSLLPSDSDSDSD